MKRRYSHIHPPVTGFRLHSPPQQEGFAVSWVDLRGGAKVSEQQIDRLLEFELVAPGKNNRPLATPHQRVTAEQHVIDADAYTARGMTRRANDSDFRTVPGKCTIHVLAANGADFA